MRNELQRTSTWYNDRLAHFSGSNFGTLMGTTFKKTALNLILEKYLESITHKRQEKKYESESLDWGIKNEADGIKLYESESGNKVVDSGFVLLKGYEEYAGCSPDGLIYEDEKLVGIIECKAPFNPANHSKAILAEGIPKASYRMYYTQVQFNLMVTGAEWCDWFSYEAREDRIFIKRYERDEEYITRIKEQLDKAIEVLKGLSSNEVTEEDRENLKVIDAEMEIKAKAKEEKALSDSRFDITKAWSGLDAGACEGLI